MGRPERGSKDAKKEKKRKNPRVYRDVLRAQPVEAPV